MHAPRPPVTQPAIAPTLETPLGPLWASWNSEGALTQLWFRTQPRVGSTVTPDARWVDQLREEMTQYFAGQRTRFDVAVAPAGTPFQLRVWTALLSIPWGETRTYAQLAEAVGSPRGFRAVGGANGANPVAIVIPCHRVVAGSGLGGYTGGLDLKRQLLALEGHPDYSAASAAGELPLF
jgi:methylated-DNA-[protein]-cysteine S-methyltransferase